MVIIFLNKDDNINKSITIIEIIKRALPTLKINNEIFWDFNEDKKNLSNLNKKIGNNKERSGSNISK